MSVDRLYHQSDIVCLLLMITMIAKDDTLKNKDIAKRFGRSTRTISRWMSLLRHAGIDIVYRYGYKGYPAGFEIRHIEPELLNILSIASDSLSTFDPQAAKAHLHAKTRGVTWFEYKFKKEEL